MDLPRKTLLAACVAAMLGGCAATPEEKEIVLTEQDAGRTLVLAAGKSFTVDLKSNPTTGYRWQSEPPQPEKELLHLERDDFTAPPGELCGAPGRQRLTFSAGKPGQTTLRLIYVRPWEKPPRPVAAFQVPVTVK